MKIKLLATFLTFMMMTGMATAEEAVILTSAPEQVAIGAVGMPNPIKDYKSVSAVAEAVGFRPLTLDENEQFALTHSSAIQSAAQVSYMEKNVKNNNRILVRTALRSTVDGPTLSGYYGTPWQVDVVNHTIVFVTESDSSAYAAYWRSGAFIYSVSATESTHEDFGRIVNSLVRKTEKERIF